MADGPRAVAVVDLGFGDAGKGLVTDYLTRKLGATAVVRFNGGAQAGHNVVTPEGRHHTFSQVGSGGFVPNVETWLGPEMVVHPTALLLEARHLETCGVSEPLSRLHMHDAAPVVTPFDQALGRLRELARRDRRHGSCGVGIGEVARDLRRGEPVVRAADLRNRQRLFRVLQTTLERKAVELRELLPDLPHSPEAEQELAIFGTDAIALWVELALTAVERVHVVDESAFRRGLADRRAIVFEGAQGVLLDRDHGFYPYTSPGDCTLRGAETIAATLDIPLTRLAVLRSYTVRHGKGPLPGELRPRPEWAHEAHNADGPWQGAVRVSYPDLVLSRYALRAVGGVDSLAVTHADRVTPSWAHIDAYRYGDARIETLPVFGTLSLDDRARESERLLSVTPVTTRLELDPDDPGRAIAEHLAAALGVELGMVSRGPTYKDVEAVGT